MDTKKIIIDGKEVEIYTGISDEEIEDNRDLISNKESLEDTIELDDVVSEINNGDDNG